MKVTLTILSALGLVAARLHFERATPTEIEMPDETGDAIPPPAPMDPKVQKCTIHSDVVKVWQEHGQTRRKILVTAMNTDPAAYCNHFSDQGNVGVNKKCYLDPEWADGHVVDVSHVVGLGGDDIFNREHHDSMERWRVETGCETV